MKNNLETTLEQEITCFVEVIENQRHHNTNMLGIYQQIEQDITTRYNITPVKLKSLVLQEQIKYMENGFRKI